MAAKKRPGTQEPLLNTAARKLGHAAGTLTKATHQFTENLSGLVETVESKVRNAANMGSPRERSKSHVRSPKKKTRKSVRTKKAKKAGRVKRQGPGGKTRRGGAKTANARK